MKRALSFLLLLVVLVAVMAPCNADDCCRDLENTAMHHDKGKFPESTCSPFSICGTCPVLLFGDAPLPAPLPLPHRLSHTGRYRDLFPGSYRSVRWQPPRPAALS